jgi:hypothetical protein
MIPVARRSWAAVLVAIAVSSPAPAQYANPPTVVGWLAGALAQSNPDGVRVSGTDLGWTFEHRGRLFILFGDTWITPSMCDSGLFNDDAQGILPLQRPAQAPRVTYFTRTGAPLDFDGIRIYRDGRSLPMLALQVPVAGFSDGTDAFAVFSREEYHPCEPGEAGTEPHCPPPPGAPEDRFRCSPTLGECAPPLAPLLCDPASRSGCLRFQRCEPGNGTGFCIDPGSSQYIGTVASEPFAAVHRVDIGVQRQDDPVAYDSVAVWHTNRFFNVTARTVTKFLGTSSGNDYRPGHAAVLMWGRPGFWAERGRQAQLYLMAHPLPFAPAPDGKRIFEPQYFAGIDPGSGDPRWSRSQSEAQPLALDGRVGGSPHEELPLPDQMAISWLPEPVNKWVMLYGGDVPDLFLSDPRNARPGPAPGSIRIRFADHPWGPWSVAIPHLIPGDPEQIGDPYGPGGFLFHRACQPPNGLACGFNQLALCEGATPIENGRLYAPNIIDPYTEVDPGRGVTIYWNVSTINPYGVILMKSTIRPGQACAGDCDGNDRITVDEIVTLVNVALGTTAARSCPNSVPDSTEIDVTFVVRAVHNALTGCPS